MTIYIASKFSNQHLLLPRRKALVRLGHAVKSSWLDEPAPEVGGIYSLDFQRQVAKCDIQDIQDADVFILDTTGGISEGKNVEFGIALQRHITTITIGPLSSIFHQLADVSCDTWDECLQFLQPRQEA